MIGKPPSSPPGAGRKRDLIELRLANLRRELEAETDPTSEAAILYEVGVLYEHELDQLNQAAEQYERAHAVDPLFQPAIMARMRIAERQPNGHLLPALCDAQLAAAQGGALRASALVDLALRSDDWASLLREAMEHAPQPVIAALILEWLAEARGDQNAVRDAVRAQAEHASEPDLRAALWLDFALCEIDAGEIDRALEALERACESDAVRWHARSLQLRTAREHQRWEALDRVATSMARQLEAEAMSDEPSDPLGVSVPDAQRLPMAALLWREAASCRVAHFEDPETASRYLESALRLRPEDRSLRLEALLLAERAGDESCLHGASEWFHESAPEDPAFVAYEIRRAMGAGHHDDAIAVLRSATERYPQSEYAGAALDVALMRAEAHEERLEQLCRRAQAAEGDARANVLWRAAQLAGADPGLRDRAQSLYAEALNASMSSKTRITREAMGEGLRSKQLDRFVELADALLAEDVDPEERAALVFSKYEVMHRLLRSDQDARLLLRDAINDPSQSRWAPHVARARAAWADDAALLAQAHEALASLTQGEDRLGHLCGAGQAHARAGNWNAAERALREALDDAPDDSYVLSLLQSVLREGGRPEEMVSLAQERSHGESGSTLDELSLLLAGATAERKGNLVAARHAYEEAIKAAPTSPSAALALLDVARRQQDTNATIRAYAQLAQTDLEGGVGELYALLRGDALGFAGREAEAGAAYMQALEHPTTSLAAAIGILSIPSRFTTGAQRAASGEALLGADAPPEPNRFAKAYAAWRDTLGSDDAPDGDTWLRLSELAPTGRLRAGALLQGLRFASITQDPEVLDDLFILAQEAAETAEEHLEAATAIDEVLSPGDDAEFRAAAFARKLHHSDALGRIALEAAYCRALVEAERGADAVALLSEAVDERPDDLELWETLRNAARQAQEWPLVALACERLAPFVDGALRADLLEEAGVVRLDCLGQDQQAEDLFRGALAADPGREVAFRRLHDLLTDKEDAEALQELVSSRLAQGGPKDRLELLYERARLLRGFSDREAALEALDELFASVPDHPGALALAAEIYVSLQRWTEAVECLQRLSSADIAEEQRRVAHLGAADFLESRLGRSEDALAELRAVEALGLADAATLTRIGALESGLGNIDTAIESYRQALRAAPTHRGAITALVAQLDGSSRSTAIEGYERAIWERIARGKLDADLLDGLHDAAAWQSQPERAAAVSATRRALGLPTADEVGGIDPSWLDDAPLDAIRDADPNAALEQVVLRAGPSLSKGRWKSKHEAGPEDPIFGQLTRLCQRFGARLGTVLLSDEHTSIAARLGREGEIEWLLPSDARSELRGSSLFLAGRVAWAAPRGGAELIAAPVDDIAATVAAILRASRCTLDDASLPRRSLKLPRGVRRAVHDLLGGARLTSASIREWARGFEQRADRAGLLVSGEIGAAMERLLPTPEATLEALRHSERGLALLRFWLDAESPLWRAHA